MRGSISMDSQYNDSGFSERRAVRPFSVIVIGAGVGGLAIGLCMRKTGHNVQRRREITEVGAGIQIAPNASRILRRFGVLEETMKYATVLEQNSLRRWKDNEELGSIPLVPDVEDHFGAPLAVIHRADLQRILLNAARGCGCKILRGHEVVDTDEQFLPYVNLSILYTRRTSNGAASHVTLLGGFLCAAVNTLYNVVLVRKADKEKPRKTSWTTHGEKEEIVEHCRGWCPVIQALIRHAPSSGIMETPMNILRPLPTWVKGQMALAGDACHYMKPYVAQGAAAAIEDAGTLAMIFTCTDNIELGLEMYQLIRKDRSEIIQASATNTGHTLHLPDGEEQERRDDSIRAASRGVGANPDQWSDKKTREFMWQVDVMAETINRFESLTREVGTNKEK
ncbi:hypothetical protein E0Z10_g7558 [Xylaria hypoxylon]|uniref:FAD-binding domain-containing protein n=1 Tax=Xylaria hypoxylon TaxID=37992 RepID=A0A4Z0YMC5_9PEZI|nr:hypothetical protein E0Z10_g7558 [Xylaria hypoxylon]